MADSRISVRGFRTGFLAVVLLLTGSAAFSLWNELRIKERDDRLVTASLERERLIGLIRVDAELLSEDADDHINATDDEAREKADEAMSVVLKEIRFASDAYAATLVRGETDMWRR